MCLRRLAILALTLLAVLALASPAPPAGVMASYNAGPAYAMKHRRVPPYAETQDYVRKGLAYIRALG